MDNNETSQQIEQEDLWEISNQTGNLRHNDDELIVGKSYFTEYSEREFGQNIAEAFHENTKNSLLPVEWSTTRSAQIFNESDEFTYVIGRSPDYTEYSTVELPERASLDLSLEAALMRRQTRRELSGESISLQELATFLGYSFGVNRRDPKFFEGPDGETAELAWRTYPSGGRLYSVEPYLLITNVDGLTSGIYYYKPEKHVLRLLKEDPKIESEIEEAFANIEALNPTHAAVTVVFAAMFWRAMAKYGPRGYRYILHEAGHMAQNAQLVAEALELCSAPNAGVREHSLDTYLGLDGVNESSMYSVVIGRGGDYDE